MILPAECDDQPVGNNVAELRAAVEALVVMPGDWRGTLYSDSQVTLGRLFDGWPLRGVPVDLAWRTQQLREWLRRFGQVRGVLLQGYPTRADLERGVGKKRGLPVSRWNVLADRMCQERAALYLNQREEVAV